MERKLVRASLFLLAFFLFSLAHAKKKESSHNPFMGTFAMTYQTPFDPVEGADPMSVLAGGLNYQLSREKGFSFTTRYFQTMIGHTNDNTTQGLADSVFTFFDGMPNGPGMQFGNDFAFGYSVGAILPTSDASQKAGLRLGILGTATVSYMYKRATFQFINTLNYNSFEWDTADPSGYQYNEDLILRNGLSGRLALNSRRTWSTGLTLTYSTIRNTIMNYDNSFMLAADVMGIWSRNIMTNFMVGGADRRTDTTNLFLYDRMFVLFGITVMI